MSDLSTLSRRGATQPRIPPQLAIRRNPLAGTRPGKAPSGSELFSLALHAVAIAEATVASRASALEGEAPYGALKLIQIGAIELSKAVADKDFARLQDSSTALAQAFAVLDMLANSIDDLVMRGAQEHLNQGKNALDAGIEAMNGGAA